MNQADLKLLAQQLKDATDLTRSLSKSLQDEVLLNAKARIGFKKDIEHLCELVAELRRIYSGNGKPALEVRLVKMEGELEEINKRHDTESDRIIKKSERFWKFFMQNSPVILTWLGLAIWTIVQLIMGSGGQLSVP